MAIKKQEFYEGAALHLLIRAGDIKDIRYKDPFFLVNGRVFVLLKYSTKGRSPWGFTFTADEQMYLKKRGSLAETKIGLICGSDGVAALDYESFLSVASLRKTALHVSCYREHGEHYELRGPDGVLTKKIAPSSWQNLVDE